jgi:ATP-binding cassette, subfamily B, bacterial
MTRRVWRFAQPYRGQILLLLFSILLITSLGLLPPLFMRALIDEALPNQDMRQLNLLALGLLVVPIITGVLGVWQRQISAAVGEGVIYDLRCALYGHMQSMSLRFFTQTRTGELMSRLNNDVVGAQSAVTGTLVTIVTNIVTVVITLGIMILLEWRLTLLSLLVLPFFIWLARRIGGVLRRLRRRSMELNAEMNASMNETLNVSGALLVKLFGREEREMGRFAGYAGEVRDIGVESAVVGRWFFMGLGVATAVGTALVYWVGGYLTFLPDSGFTIGSIVAFGAYLNQLYGPLTAITNAPVDFAQSMVSFERVFEVLDLPVEIEEDPKAVTLTAVSGQLTFENVTFSYTPSQPSGLAEVRRYSWHSNSDNLVKRGKEGEELNGENGENSAENEIAPERIALENVSFSIEPGQLVALVGPSGAGKTTTTYLIPRLYDPTHGRVLLDGHDIRHLSRHTLAQNIGMVTQETYLFYDTVRANLLYARPSATDRRDDFCRPSRQHPRLHQQSARWLRHRGGRTGLPPQRGRTATHRHRPRHPQRPPHLGLG